MVRAAKHFASITVSSSERVQTDWFLTFILCGVNTTGVYVMCVISMAQPVPEQIDFLKEEEKILQLWKELNAFQTSLIQSKNRPRLETWSLWLYLWLIGLLCPFGDFSVLYIAVAASNDMAYAVIKSLIFEDKKDTVQFGDRNSIHPSVFLFVRLSVCQMRELLQNERNSCPHSYTGTL